jgi:hypothetical protein
MRELANMTARAAIDKHAYRNWGRAAFGKMVIALLAGGAGGGAVYFAPARDSMLMYAGLSCFVIALFWLLQAGILIKNVICAMRRQSRLAAENAAPNTNVVAPHAPTPSEDLPPAEIITVCESDEFQAGDAAEANGDCYTAECIGENAPVEGSFATSDEPYEAVANAEEVTVIEPVAADLVEQGYSSS